VGSQHACRRAEPPWRLLRQRSDGAFFSSLKSELADRFDSCGEAKVELFDYIEVFYNQRRRHSRSARSALPRSSERPLWS
jgi:Integrase core domain